jgi:hypothetical protein
MWLRSSMTKRHPGLGVDCHKTVTGVPPPTIQISLPPCDAFIAAPHCRDNMKGQDQGRSHGGLTPAWEGQVRGLSGIHDAL